MRVGKSTVGLDANNPRAINTASTSRSATRKRLRVAPAKAAVPLQSHRKRIFNGGKLLRQLRRKVAGVDVGIGFGKHVAHATDCAGPRRRARLEVDLAHGVEDGHARLVAAAHGGVVHWRQVRPLLQRRKQRRDGDDLTLG